MILHPVFLVLGGLLMLVFADIQIQTLRSVCSKELPYTKSHFKGGDLILGGVIQMYNLALIKVKCDFTDICEDVYCGGWSRRYSRHLLAFYFAIDEINKNPEILPNITLGFHIIDACHSAITSQCAALIALSGKGDPVPGYRCHQQGKLTGFIGSLSSMTSHVIARLTGVLRYPQISYGVMDRLFNDRVEFPFFYRTVPNGYSQNQGLIQLLNFFRWNWVGIVTSNDESDRRDVEELKREIITSGNCVAFLEQIPSVENYNIQMHKALNQYIKKIHFKTPNGREIYFDDKGNVPVYYDIVNWVKLSDGSFSTINIGHVNQSAPEGHQFFLNSSAILWNPYFNQTPRSACSESCAPGYRKILPPEKPVCCYDCVPCSEGEFSNTTGTISTEKQCIIWRRQALPWHIKVTAALAFIATGTFQTPLGASSGISQSSA